MPVASRKYVSDLRAAGPGLRDSASVTVAALAYQSEQTADAPDKGRSLGKVKIGRFASGCCKSPECGALASTATPTSSMQAYPVLGCCYKMLRGCAQMGLDYASPRPNRRERREPGQLTQAMDLMHVAKLGAAVRSWAWTTRSRT